MIARDFTAGILKLPHGDKFKPRMTASRAGDSIEIRFRPGSVYGIRVDDLVTVLHTVDGDDLAGALIKGLAACLSRIQDQLPGFAISIHDGSVGLAAFFTARLWTLSAEELKDIPTIHYQRLIEVAKQSDIMLPADLQAC